MINNGNKQQSHGKYYIGLMSGTSADGIDLALVDFNAEQKRPQVIASYYQAYSREISEKITSLYQPNYNEIDRGFHLDIELAQLFSLAVVALLTQEKLKPADIIAIGNHGQTIRHRPNDKHPFTLQIGCCQTLATLTGIRVVGQFRRKDMALGGQGAPLVPIFHQQLFPQNEKANVVVNIGGIANVTFLPPADASVPVLGFDTGPGNALLDDWFIKNNPASDDKFDRSGAWAQQGIVNQGLLEQFMQSDYIKAEAPKSTGREYFHLQWLEQQLISFNDAGEKTPSAIDIQATLLAFTVCSICDDVIALTKNGNIYLCGGGVHNNALIDCLQQRLNLSAGDFDVNTMESLGIDSDLLEAMAFAWLAYAFDHKLDSNMPAVTGASVSCTLGNAYFP